MKVRFTCSVFDLALSDPDRSGHYVVVPEALGIDKQTGWPLDSMLAPDDGDLARIATRAVETAGNVDTLDFLIRLPDQALPRPRPLEDDVETMVKRLRDAFQDHASLEYLFVFPTADWLSRLSRYHFLRMHPGTPGYRMDEGKLPSYALLDRLEDCGFACVEIAPEDVFPQLASRFHGPTVRALPAGLEGFSFGAVEYAHQVTADPDYFAAWAEIQSSPFVKQLPSGWAGQLGKYWPILPVILRHLSVSPDRPDSPGPV